MKKYSNGLNDNKIKIPLKMDNLSISRGITLIALIVTIIILLILVGVIINLTIGDNGLFKVANKATTDYKKAQYFEEINIEILTEQAERFEKEKSEEFILSLKKRIQTKSWTSEEKVLMLKETENGLEEQDNVADNDILLIETKDGYEIIVEVNNTTIEAVIRQDYFEQIGKGVILILDPNGGNGDKEVKEIRKNFKITLNSPNYTKSDYKFVGWSEDINGEKTRYLAGSKYKVQNDVTLYAIWEKNTAKITFNANNGTTDKTELTVTKDLQTTLPPNSFRKEEHIFKKWNTKSSGDGVDYEDEAIISINEDLDLYAIWEKNTAIITFNANNGTTDKTELKVRKNVEIVLPANTFTKEGYVFKSWNTKPSDNGNEYADKAKITIEEDINLYAQWKNYEGMLNEYVSNGLILHLDAINNDGENHNSSQTTVWRDLSVFGNDATLYNCTVNSNNIEFNGSSSYATLPKGSLGAWQPCTIEIVMNAENKSIVLGDDVSVSQRGLCVSDNNTLTVMAGNWSGGHPYMKKTTLDLYSRQHSYSLSYSGTDYSDIKLYIDFQQTTQASDTNKFANNTKYPIIGKRNWSTGSEWRFKGKIYSIRVYNRQLTEKEIQQNYKIDKARFKF